MSIRKITSKERRKAGHIYCPYCKPDKVNAMWRATNLLNKFKLNIHVACNVHKDCIPVLEEVQSSPLYVVDLRSSEYTEADYQTWMRL
jgi:hypothetical protein